MLQGNIYVVSDPEVVMGLSPTHNVICVSGETHTYPDFIQATKATSGSILLPPPEASFRSVEGDPVGFRQLYFGYLMTKEPRMIFAIVLRALFNGKNIIIYLTKDEEQLDYIKAFMEFIQMNYGITVGYMNCPCAFDSSYSHVVLNELLLHDLMTPEEYMMALPITSEVLAFADPVIVTKLAVYFNPYVANQNVDEYRASLIHYHQSLINTKGAARIVIGRMD